MSEVPEVTQAAERLRRAKTDGESSVYFYADPQFFADRSTIINAYLSEHAADDDEPITEEWLTKTYGEPANCWAGWRIGKFYIGHCFGWHLTRESPIVNVNNITTRCQLRKLLSALG